MAGTVESMLNVRLRVRIKWWVVPMLNVLSWGAILLRLDEGKFVYRVGGFVAKHGVTVRAIPK